MQIINEIALHSVNGDLCGSDSAAVIALPVALAFGAGAETGLLIRPTAWYGIG